MSNRELPMMPWYPDQFQASTVAWTFAERSLYRSLLDAQWQLGVLPADPKRLRIIVGMPEQDFSEAWQTVSEKFVPQRGGLVNKRLEYHRDEALRRKQHASTAGRKGGQASVAAAAKRRLTDGQATVQRSYNPPSPSPLKEEEPHTPQSGAVNGHAGKGKANPRALGANPRALGTNPRAVAERQAEERRWTTLKERASKIEFREPQRGESVGVYETQLRIAEHEKGIY